MEKTDYKPCINDIPAIVYRCPRGVWSNWKMARTLGLVDRLLLLNTKHLDEGQLAETWTKLLDIGNRSRSKVCSVQ